MQEVVGPLGTAPVPEPVNAPPPLAMPRVVVPARDVLTDVLGYCTVQAERGLRAAAECAADARVDVLRSAHFAALRAVHAGYSAGEHGAGLRSRFDLWCEILGVLGEARGASPLDARDPEDYLATVWVVSLGVLLAPDGVEALAGWAVADRGVGLLPRLCAIASGKAGCGADAGLPSRRAASPDGAVAAVDVGSSPCKCLGNVERSAPCSPHDPRVERIPVLHRDLVHALDAAGSARLSVITAYLCGYETATRAFPWQTRRGVAAPSCGVWCFEAAALLSREPAALASLTGLRGAPLALCPEHRTPPRAA
ncbi:MAG: hypothetical protein KDC87_08625 [Planctomycetes bacterium]|nr:hypothetical protein [Planctomycetota bacterium]